MKRSPVDFGLLFATVLYVVVGAILLPMFRYQINPDGLSYLAVAGHWLNGDPALAVNGYWGPLLSWLLVPGLASGVEPLLAGKLLGLATGMAALLGLGRLASVAGLRGWLRTVCLASFVPVLVFFSLWYLTPDMLMVAIWLHYLAFLLDEERPFDARTCAWCGFFGALSYVTKAYGLYIFILHFTLVAVLRFIGASDGTTRRRMITAWLAGLGVCLVLSGGWIGALSAKYGEFTISTTGPYNHALVGPESPGHPMVHVGFLAPVNERALSVWEDPSVLELPAWSSIGSSEEMRHQVRLIIANIKHIVISSLQFNLLLPFIVVATVIVAWRRWRRDRSGDLTVWLLFSMIVYPAGYVLVLAQTRYYWIVLLLSVMLGFALIGRIVRSGSRPRLAVWLAAAQLCLMILYPARVMPDAIRSVQVDQELPGLIRAVAPVDGPLAASGSWSRGIALSYRLGVKYYGVRGDLADGQVLDRLRELGVEWYVVWEGDEPAPAIVAHCAEVPSNSITGLRLFRVTAED